MSKILVTGGAGAIGSHLVRRLCQDNQVLVLDDFSSGFIENIRGLPIKFYQGSIVDDEFIKGVFAERPNIVIHLAANFANQKSVDYPQKDLLVNGLGTLKILQSSLEVDVERFIYASSSCVYGNISGRLSEDTLNKELDTPYALTKMLGEQYVNFYHRQYKMPTVILRLFNSYGPGEYPGKYRNVIPNFISSALCGQPIIITGSGNETRDFTYVGDTVQALCLAMSHPKAVGQTFNVGTGKEISINELAKEIIALCNARSPIEYQPRRNWDSVSRRCSDISKIQQVMGYSPTTDIATGLRQTHRWLVDHHLVDR